MFMQNNPLEYNLFAQKIEKPFDPKNFQLIPEVQKARQENAADNQELANTQFVPIKFYTSVSASAKIIYEARKQEVEAQFYKFFGDNSEAICDTLEKQVLHRRQSSNKEITAINPDILVDLGGGFGISGLDYISRNDQAISIVVDQKSMCDQAYRITTDLFIPYCKRVDFIKADVKDGDKIFHDLVWYIKKHTPHDYEGGVYGWEPFWPGNGIKTICFNNQGLLRYIAKKDQPKFFAQISRVAKRLTENGFEVSWVFVDTELAPKNDSQIRDVASVSNVSKFTNIDTISNLPESILDLQKSFIDNGWTIIKYKGSAIVAKII
jgi:hypothetical protein